ncbi:MAG: PD40 domain-containing protein [Phycisphaerae bacterium]|nr:PD40 domain-containing protein [Phycisphaerae bacterium]
MNTMRKFLSLACVVVAICAASGARADFTFGTPVNVGTAINTATNEADPWISPDGLMLLFAQTANWAGAYDIRVSVRATSDDPWGSSVSLGLWGGASDVTVLYSPITVMPGFTTADGLELYFNEVRPGGYGDHDLWVIKRKTIEDAWGEPENLGPNVNGVYTDIAPTVSPDGLELYFSGYTCTSARPGGCGCADIWMTRRATRDDPWAEPVNLGWAINSAANDARPRLLADGLLLFFDSGRAGGRGENDLYVSKRATLLDPWSRAQSLGPIINSSAFEECPYLSADGFTLYWDSGRSGGHGGHDIWQSAIIPIVDFTGDGRVDEKDVLAMIGCWGGSESICDIGPTAWGDSVVDIQDLKVLARYIDAPVVDPTLLVHWPLDETEGSTAYDRVGENDAIMMGNPTWQPEGGQVDGALALDGVGDFIAASQSANLTGNGLAVLVWVQGGAPGQTVVGRQQGDDWLYLDASHGGLSTALRTTGRVLEPLTSDAVIADGQWHHIGLVWDGTNRILYVDGQEVASDALPTLDVSSVRLVIGTGKTLAPGTFWSGLIDDVRVYNRAVKP